MDGFSIYFVGIFCIYWDGTSNCLRQFFVDHIEGSGWDPWRFSRCNPGGESCYGERVPHPNLYIRWFLYRFPTNSCCNMLNAFSRNLVQLHLSGKRKRPETYYKRYGIIQQYFTVTETPSILSQKSPNKNISPTLSPHKKGAYKKGKTLETSPPHPFPKKILSPKKPSPKKIEITLKPWRTTTWIPHCWFASEICHPPQMYPKLFGK